MPSVIAAGMNRFIIRKKRSHPAEVLITKKYWKNTKSGTIMHNNVKSEQHVQQRMHGIVHRNGGYIC